MKNLHTIFHTHNNIFWNNYTGSGKKALLDVIAKRSDGGTRGQVMLNGSSLTKRLFQQRCGYVTHSVDFIPGLTVSQTLHYTPTIVSSLFNGIHQIYAFQFNT